MDKYNGVTAIVNADGEVFNIPEGTTVTVQSKKDEVQKKEIVERKTIRNLSANQRLEHFAQSETLRGDFFVAVCLGANDETFYNQVSEPTVNKIMYLATYMASDNCLCDDKGNIMTKGDIANVLNLHRHSFTSFWKECTAKNIIVGDDTDGYFLPKDKFRFLNNKRINRKENMMIKVFKHAVRYMYENTDERSKKMLSHLYKLIPYINLKYNVLCTNPFEMDKEKIDKISLSDMCLLLGVDVGQKKRVLNCLKKLSFIDKQGYERSVITYSWDRYQGGERYWIRINPQFYAGYAKTEDWIEMLDGFKIDAKDDET